MIDQSFSSKELLKVCKKDEWELYNMTKSDLIVKLEDASIKILRGTFEFKIKKLFDYFLTEDLVDTLVLRKLNYNLKKLYKVEQSNRRIIIEQVNTLLKEDCPMWVFKTDIEKFYNSINRDRVLLKIKEDFILSYHSQQLLRKVFEDNLIKATSGLPMGMSISSTISELFMRNFDRKIKRCTGVYFYARFVDDIIIFTYDKNTAHSVSESIEKQLTEIGLSKKIEKTGILDGNKLNLYRPLEFLGYRFLTNEIKVKNEWTKTVKIEIAEKKIKKIKSRIILSILDFEKNKNFILLENRIKFLTGNYSIKQNYEGEHLKAGIYYNYPLVNNTDIFSQLDIFYKKLLFSKTGSLGKRVSKILDTNQKKRLCKYNFKNGFTKKIHRSFTFDEMLSIKKAW